MSKSRWTLLGHYKLLSWFPSTARTLFAQFLEVGWTLIKRIILKFPSWWKSLLRFVLRLSNLHAAEMATAVSMFLTVSIYDSSCTTTLLDWTIADIADEWTTVDAFYETALSTMCDPGVVQLTWNTSSKRQKLETPIMSWCVLAIQVGTFYISVSACKYLQNFKYMCMQKWILWPLLQVLGNTCGTTSSVRQLLLLGPLSMLSVRWCHPSVPFPHSSIPLRLSTPETRRNSYAMLCWTSSSRRSCAGHLLRFLMGWLSTQ